MAGPSRLIQGLSVMSSDNRGEAVILGKVLANPVAVKYLKRVLKHVFSVIKLTCSSPLLEHTISI